jgi:hypothetical protein
MPTTPAFARALGKAAGLAADDARAARDLGQRRTTFTSDIDFTV